MLGAVLACSQHPQTSGETGVCGCPPTQADTHAEASTPNASLVYKRARESVVTVSPVLAGQQFSGVGAGFFIKGHPNVVTAGHVVRGFDTVLVMMADGNTAPFRVARTDSRTDIALLEPVGEQAKRPPGLSLESNASTGTWVMAIGAPIGLGQTATVGILSSTERTMSDANLETPGLDASVTLFQSDAVLHPGNSGGPLLDSSGKVVAMAIASFVRTKGVGFALPARELRLAVDAATARLEGE